MYRCNDIDTSWMTPGHRAVWRPSSQVLQEAEEELRALGTKAKKAEEEFESYKLTVYKLYKAEIRYYGAPDKVSIRNAIQWVYNLSTGKDENGNKLDKRLRSPFKESYKYIVNYINKLLDIEIEKIEIFSLSNSYTVYYFNYKGRKFRLTIPKVREVTLTMFDEYGAMAFMMQVAIYKDTYNSKLIHKSFEEPTFKGIIDKYLEEESNEGNN